MYSTTNVFDNTVRGNVRKFIAKIKCGKNENTDAIKSLKQYSQLPSDTLTIGGAFTSTLELALWNPDFSLQNKEFQVELGLETEDGTTEWCPLGYYTSESLKRSTDGMITITAYDRIYSKMSGAFFSKLTYPADAIDVLNEISQKTGVEIQTTNLTSGVKIQKRKVVSNKEIDENGSIEQVTTYENPFDGYTYREALGYIAMLFCKYAIADRDGSVKLVWFNEIENYKVTADYYYELTTDETAFSVGKITCNTGEKEFEVGSGTNNIQLSNPIMTQERLNYIYDVAKTLTFIPSSFPFYGDMRLDIGDIIKVVKTDGSIYSVPIMSVTQEFDGGLRTSVQSFGGLEQEVETKGPIATRLERQYTELLLIKELVGEKASFDNLYALSGEFGSLKADYGEFEKLVTEDFKAVNADIINLKSNSITTDNLDAKLAEIGALTAETADLKYATIVDLNALSGKFEELSAKSITTGNLSASVANLGYLKTDEADIKYAKIETLETEYLQLKNLSAETAKLGYLTAIEADIGYAKIDFSNVGKQVVSSSMIMDSAVTNEKVANLSANKITSGTIDASMIRVINLNADNLTVGTINGKLIGDGSVDLDKLSKEVPTKEYLDKVQNELQGQIDGAIETFTKAEIPTLNNEPASLWVDNATKDKHIGDICYVVNPTSSADGYCYRFADLGANGNHDYSWVLIKDNDVTKALQDIIDINGEITGIKKFDVEISSWRTDTDQELSSLKSKTSSLETDIGKKVESSVFNELKQTVDENSLRITSVSDVVKDKADNSTVSELTNTVNEVKQTANSNSMSISEMKSDIEQKADGKEVTALVQKTTSLEQNLDGFKTTVSNTYVTKETADNLQKQIDGAIETFSGNEVPTLLNIPASEWTADNEKDTHIGDLYIVNSNGGDYAGFYYRFEKNGNSYQWTLLKDNEISKALQDSKEANEKADFNTNSIKELSTSIEQTNEKISTEVKRIDDLGEKSSELEQSIEGISIKLNETTSAAAKTATNYLNFSSKGLLIGDMTASKLGKNVLIDTESVNIRDGDTVLATFGKDLIELGKNATSSVISLCGGKGTIKSTPLSSGSTYYGLELSSDVILKLNSYDVKIHGTDGSSYQGYVSARGDADTATSEVYMMATASDKIRTLIDLYCDGGGGFIKESVTDGSGTNDLEIYPSHTFFKKRIVLANNQALHGETTDGQTQSMVHMSSNDIIVLGYGSYTKGIGKTVLSGNIIEFLVKTAGTRYKPYYDADLEDGEVDTWRVNGLVTTSKTQIVFMIPLGKPVIGNPTITVTSMMGLEIRQNGKYTHGSALNQYIIPDSYKAALVGGNCIHVTANVSDTTNAINNETCFIRADIAIEFE